MRILICDDDASIVEQLNTYTQEFFTERNQNCPEIVCFSNGSALLADRGKKDIVFLDIKLPDANGVLVGQALKKADRSSIIFIITSFSGYLDEAMHSQLFCYLSKPVDKQRFFRNLKAAMKQYHTSTASLVIETKTGVYTVSASDVISVEAQERKVIVHTVSNDYESIHTIQYWLHALPKNCFFQSHRSFIVNFEHVTNFDHTLIYLSNKRQNAYLTRRRYTQFKEAYLLYLESTR